MKVLITGGGTREPIDGVRFISNFSSGKTSAFLADSLAEAGVKVIFLCGTGSTTANSQSVVHKHFSTFSDLDKQLKEILSTEKNSLSWVIHAAAVSDFSVARIEQAGVGFGPMTDVKLDSSQALTLKLLPNFKILPKLKSYSGTSSGTSTPPKVIGFKLTNTLNMSEREDAVQKLFDGGGVDYVIQNDLHDIDTTKNIHRGAIHSLSVDAAVTPFETKEGLAQELKKLIGVAK